MVCQSQMELALLAVVRPWLGHHCSPSYYNLACHGFAILRLQNWGLELSTTSQGYSDPKGPNAFSKSEPMSQIDRILHQLSSSFSSSDVLIMDHPDAGQISNFWPQSLSGIVLQREKYGNESNSKCFLKGAKPDSSSHQHSVVAAAAAGVVESNLSNSKPLLLLSHGHFTIFKKVREDYECCRWQQFKKF